MVSGSQRHEGGGAYSSNRRVEWLDSSEESEESEEPEEPGVSGVEDVCSSAGVGWLDSPEEPRFSGPGEGSVLCVQEGKLIFTVVNMAAQRRDPITSDVVESS